MEIKTPSAEEKILQARTVMGREGPYRGSGIIIAPVILRAVKDSTEVSSKCQRKVISILKFYTPPRHQIPMREDNWEVTW